MIVDTMARAPVSWFVGLTFALSGVALLSARWSFGPDFLARPAVIPLALLAVWSPNVAALVVASAEGSVGALLHSVVAPAPVAAWLVALLPWGVTAAVAVLHGGADWRAVGPGTLALMGLGNLLLGPLGEELGWRGLLMPRLADLWGPVAAGLVVGVVWALWHAPLWAFQTPHREMPFLWFGANVVCFSVVMAAAFVLGRGAVGPAILFHLGVNVGLNWLAAAGIPSGTALRSMFPLYAALAVAAVVWLYGTSTSQ